MSEGLAGKLRFYWDLYRALLKQGMAIMVQYRFGVLIWGVWGFVGPLISLAVWTAASTTLAAPLSASSKPQPARRRRAGKAIFIVIDKPPRPRRGCIFFVGEGATNRANRAMTPTRKGAWTILWRNRFELRGLP